MAGLMKKIEDMFVAATFAQAGEFETAKEILRKDKRPDKIDRVTPSSRPRKELRAPGIER